MVAAAHGRWIASAKWDGTVWLWDVLTGQESAVLIGHVGRVAALAVAPDGTWLASAGDDRTIRIWEIPSGKTRHVLSGHTGLVATLAAAPDGTWLASGGWDKAVRIWSMPGGQCQAMMRLDNSADGMTWLDTTALAIGGTAGIYLFDFLTYPTQAER